MQTINFTYIGLNYLDENNHLERILFALKNSEHHLCMTSELLESDKLHLFLHSDGLLE